MHSVLWIRRCDDEGDGVLICILSLSACGVIEELCSWTPASRGGAMVGLSIQDVLSRFVEERWRVVEGRSELSVVCRHFPRVFSVFSMCFSSNLGHSSVQLVYNCQKVSMLSQGGRVLQASESIP